MKKVDQILIAVIKKEINKKNIDKINIPNLIVEVGLIIRIKNRKKVNIKVKKVIVKKEIKENKNIITIIQNIIIE